jgi:hypothetical protein
LSGLSISELEFYTLPQLIEVYRTIDKDNNPIKTNVLEKQIRIKMNLSASIDLSSESIQKQFDQILSDYAPIKLIKENKEKIGSKFRKVEFVLLILSFIILAFMFIYEDYTKRLSIYCMFDFGLLAAIEVVQSRYTGEITTKGGGIKKEKNPKYFRFIQAFYLVFSIVFLLTALAMIL